MTTAAGGDAGVIMYKFGYDGKTFNVEVHDGSWCADGVHIELPHQCDAWIIGDADNARLLIKDLKKAIKKFEARDESV